MAKKKQESSQDQKPLADDLKERAKKIFTSHKVDKLYFTSDATAFIEPQYARLHAESLKQSNVTIVKREEIQ